MSSPARSYVTRAFAKCAINVGVDGPDTLAPENFGISKFTIIQPGASWRVDVDLSLLDPIEGDGDGLLARLLPTVTAVLAPLPQVPCTCILKTDQTPGHIIIEIVAADLSTLVANGAVIVFLTVEWVDAPLTLPPGLT